MLVKLCILMSVCLIYISSTHANESVIEQKIKSFSLKLGVTRLIHKTDGKASVLPISNDNDYPILAQISVIPGKDNQDINAQFSSVPPLFRLDSKQRAKVRIIHSGGSFPTDRESLYWVCVKGIPPSGNDSWSDSSSPDTTKLNVSVVVNNCIKLFVRPNSISGQDALTMAEKLTWHRIENKLTGRNPTPFYINLSTLNVGGVTVDNIQHIAPFSSYTFTIQPESKGPVQWSAISDLGGNGPVISKHID